MRKKWKFLIVAIIFALLCSSTCREMIASVFAWAVLVAFSLVYMISLFVSSEQKILPRFGASFLVFGALTYFVTGLLGCVSNMEIIEDVFWEFLISPYLLISVIRERALQPGWDPSRLPYRVVPDGNHLEYSMIVVFVSIIAIVGAYSLAKGSKIGTWLWIVLLGILTVSFVGYLYVRREWVYVQVCWEVLYIAAFIFVQCGKQEVNSRVFTLSEEW